IEDQGRAWDEFKKTNDELIAAKADGKAVGELETKLAKISDDLDKLSELREQFEKIEAKLGRPQNDIEAREAADLATETKGFNAAMRADYQSKGKAIPAELSVDEYKAYKSAFFKAAIGVGMDSLSSDE